MHLQPEGRSSDFDAGSEQGGNEHPADLRVRINPRHHFAVGVDLFLVALTKFGCCFHRIGFEVDQFHPRYASVRRVMEDHAVNHAAEPLAILDGFDRLLGEKGEVPSLAAEDGVEGRRGEKLPDGGSFRG